MCTACKTETSSDLDQIFSKYAGNKSDLIPLLQDIQALQGYISSDAMAQTAEFLNIPESTIYGVVTFYAQFYLTAQGQNKIKICMGTACHVRGAGEILSAVERKLGISAGQTTPDLKFTLERVACFGSCALAPVVVVNDKVYGNVTPEKALEILEGIE